MVYLNDVKKVRSKLKVLGPSLPPKLLGFICQSWSLTISLPNSQGVNWSQEEETAGTHLNRH